MCVLSLLAKRDYYGFELVQTISEHMDLSEGTVYPLLHRLKKEGLCTTYVQESESGPMRKYYQITEDGLEQQEDLLFQWQDFSQAVKKIIDLSKKSQIRKKNNQEKTKKELI